MINLDARFKNKSFWIYLASALATLSQLLGYKIFPDNWADIVNTVLSLLVVMGIIVDNSTTGLNDSNHNGEDVK